MVKSPFLVEVLTEGLANNASVARKIRPAVEKRLYQKVSDASIAMALHRMLDELQRPQFGSIFLKQLSDITVRSKVVEFIFPNAHDVLRVLEGLMSKLRSRKDVFFNFSQGLYESVVVISQEFEKETLVLSLKHKPKKVSDLSVITLRLPEASLEVPGVYHPILKSLAQEGISFVEVMSVNTELSFLFKDKDVDRAFAVLKNLTA